MKIGKLVQQPTGYKAFVPEIFPPEEPLHLNIKTQQLHAKAALMPKQIFFTLFFLFEITLALWLLWGKWSFYSGLLAAAIMGSIMLFNPPILQRPLPQHRHHVRRPSPGCSQPSI